MRICPLFSYLKIEGLILLNFLVGLKKRLACVGNILTVSGLGGVGAVLNLWSFSRLLGRWHERKPVLQMCTPVVPGGGSSGHKEQTFPQWWVKGVH